MCVMAGSSLNIFVLALVLKLVEAVPSGSKFVGSGWCRYGSYSSNLLLTTMAKSSNICESRCKHKASCTAYAFNPDVMHGCNLYGGGPYTFGSGRSNTVCYALKADENVVTAGAGGWGGSCTCPDGSFYWVGDQRNSCASLACIGGISGPCHKWDAQWSYRKVECKAMQEDSNTTTTTTSTSLLGIHAYLLDGINTTITTTASPWQLLGANSDCSNKNSILGQYTWQDSLDACGQHCESTPYCHGFAFDGVRSRGRDNCVLWTAPCRLIARGQSYAYHQYFMLRFASTTTLTTTTTTTTSSTSTTIPEDTCIKLSFDFVSSTARCSYEDVLAEMSNVLKVIEENGEGCTHDAVAELNLHFGVADAGEARVKVEKLCEDHEFQSFPWEQITDRGHDFDKLYFSGLGPWNLEVESMHYGKRINHLKTDAKRVGDTYVGLAQTSRMSWPGFVESLADCPLRAVTCCFSGDRQADDNNGGCARPYDTNCVNKAPADNTHVCSVNGSAPKLGVNGHGRQADVHCHSFAWSNKESDFTSTFRGNALFFASMYDHMYQRGYVKNVPGAPMCGCVESMPAVSRSDCTELDVKSSFRFSPSRAGPSISDPVVDIDFDSCRGANGRNNNNFYFYYKRLVLEGKASVEELVQLRKFVRTSLYGPEICNDDLGLDRIKDLLAEGSTDADLLRTAILNYDVEYTPPNMPMGGLYMRKPDVYQVARTYLAEEVGLESDAVSECLVEHFNPDFLAVSIPGAYFIKLSVLPALMRQLASHARRLVLV